MMRLRPLIAPLAAFLMVAASSPSPLVGRWTSEDTFTRTTLRFLPDGRYTREIRVGDAPVLARGRYRLEGKTVTLSPQGGAPVRYRLDLDGNRLTLSGGDLPEPKPFEREPNSEAAFLDDARKDAAAKAGEDALWRRRIAVGPASAKFIDPMAGLPSDPNRKHVFKASRTFLKSQLYLRLTPLTLRSAGRRQSTVFNSVKWYFSPNGRVFIRYETFHPGQRYDADEPKGEIRTFWAAYKIAPGKDGDALHVETDAGEKIALRLEDGRRRLVWGDEVYGQVDWENERMRAMRKGGASH